MNRIPEFLKSETCRQRPATQAVTCTACRHASPVNAASEIVSCDALRKMKNAHLVRICKEFEAA